MTEAASAWQRLPLIKVVGVSASGKSTLVTRLRQNGYHARPVSQEHSSVADLWQQFDKPHYLIYLDADLATQEQRRPDVTWSADYLQTERNRLAHAREHADLKIDTSTLTPAMIAQLVLAFLQQQRVRHGDTPLPPITATGSASRPVGPAESTAPATEPPPPPRRGRKKRNRPKRDQ
ncbi:MAG: hypothetical protein KF832_27110 [Caldilineaceae bacterium]|nr:hypothetical protein [Caldilineaceae bacterium]